MDEMSLPEKLPSFGVSLIPIFLPVVLILLYGDRCGNGRCPGSDRIPWNKNDIHALRRDSGYCYLDQVPRASVQTDHRLGNSCFTDNFFDHAERRSGYADPSGIYRAGMSVGGNVRSYSQRFGLLDRYKYVRL